MKIVSIGNSFSEDAQAYLHALAVQIQYTFIVQISPH